MGDQGRDPMGMWQAGGCGSDPAACLWEGLVLGITPAASIPGAVGSWVLPVLHHDRLLPGLGRLFPLLAAVLINTSQILG